MGGYFYADMITGQKVWRLDGPFASEPEARAALPAAKRMAVDLIATAAFASFGTMRTDDDLGPGCLTAKLHKSPWYPSGHGGGARPWTLLRHIENGVETLSTRGKARRFGSLAAARAAADKLNALP